MRDVHFSYPNRPTVKVLDGLSISVLPGQTLAIVGASGCGKSTVMSLIERFYDPQSGNIVLDDTDIRALNIRWLRSQIGVVFQEPALLDRSITDNIRYGVNFGDVSDDDVIGAARAANIHDFITSLPMVCTSSLYASYIPRAHKKNGGGGGGEVSSPSHFLEVGHHYSGMLHHQWHVVVIIMVPVFS